MPSLDEINEAGRALRAMQERLYQENQPLMDNIAYLDEHWTEAQLAPRTITICNMRKELASRADCTCQMVVKEDGYTVFRADLREHTIDVLKGGEWKDKIVICVTETRYYLTNKERIDRQWGIELKARDIGSSYNELVKPKSDEAQVDKAFTRELDKAAKRQAGE